MKVLLLTVLTMTAFAANSLLNRMALGGGDAGPAAFALLRVVSGALMLMALVWWRRRGVTAPATSLRAVGPLSLTVYVLGFSFAYVTLNAGVGALILFGGVQITMFAGAVIGHESIPPRRWLGGAVAFGGLVLLMWPGGASAPATGGALLMAAAAVGWGVYSLAGRGAADALATTAGNFAVAVPLVLLAWIAAQDGATWRGALLAVFSGTVTSGLGYALWYSVLPQLQATVAAVAQLTVPVIAVMAGVVLLGESVTLRLLASGALVLSGVAVSVTAGRR